MSDQEEQGSVRRVGRKDRKKRIETGKLFPEGEEAPEAEDSAEEAAVVQTPTAEPVSRLNVPEEHRRFLPPSEERFPPLNPNVRVPPPASKPPRKRRNWPYNLVALVFFFASIGVGVFYVSIARDPFSALNPLPPFTPPPVIITTTPIPPTASDTPTTTPTLTFTPLPRAMMATLTTFTPAPFPFTLADAGVTYAGNSSEAGCNWSSIAGSVVDLDGEPLDGYRVQVVGDNVNQTVITGTAANFGEGGYEVPLGNTARRTEYAIQLLTPEGIPISQVYYAETSDICAENVALVSFEQNRAF